MTELSAEEQIQANILQFIVVGTGNDCAVSPNNNTSSRKREREPSLQSALSEQAAPPQPPAPPSPPVIQSALSVPPTSNPKSPSDPTDPISQSPSDVASTIKYALPRHSASESPAYSNNNAPSSPASVTATIPITPSPTRSNAPSPITLSQSETSSANPSTIQSLSSSAAEPPHGPPESPIHCAVNEVAVSSPADTLPITPSPIQLPQSASSFSSLPQSASSLHSLLESTFTADPFARSASCPLLGIGSPTLPSSPILPLSQPLLLADASCEEDNIEDYALDLLVSLDTDIRMRVTSCLTFKTISLLKRSCTRMNGAISFTEWWISDWFVEVVNGFQYEQRIYLWKDGERRVYHPVEPCVVPIEDDDIDQGKEEEDSDIN